MDYKLIQKINNLTLQTNDILTNDYTLNEDHQAIVDYATNYLTIETPHLEMPGKSYAVAIIYAYLIEVFFKTKFLTSLSEDDLLGNNDIFYSTFYAKPTIYNDIFSRLKLISPNFQLNTNLSQIKSTLSYFVEEFSLKSTLSEFNINTEIANFKIKLP